MNDSGKNLEGFVPGNEENFRFLGIFSNGDHFVYTFKKTEKIVQAIYAVTSHFEDHEPLKIELRERSLSFLSHALALNAENSYEVTIITQSFFTSVLEIASLLKIASISGMISSKNISILEKEIESLSRFLRDHISSSEVSKGLILSKDFFATDLPGTPASPKGQDKNNASVTSSQLNQNSSKNVVNKEYLKDKKNNRQHDIIELLKKQSNLTIKDFTKVIQGCSEKTIQRELISLVEKGIVVREGERRWSRYSLK